MKVTATESCKALIELLKSKHGGLMFHQSGGCCEGSAPLCFSRAGYWLGAEDVLLGEIGGIFPDSIHEDGVEFIDDPED